MGDSTIFSIFCSRTALFCVCVCVRFFSTIFHVRTCVLLYRYLLQYKRLCRFVETANKMATQPMLRVTIEYTVQKLSYDEGTNFSLFHG